MGMGADHSTPTFSSLADLASARVGGRAVATNDDFFASKANLVKPEPAVFIPASSRRAASGWTAGSRAAAARPATTGASSRSGMRGVVHGVNVDTRFFTGNYPSHCLDRRARRRAGRETRGQSPFQERRSKRGLSALTPFVPILPKSPLRGDGDNFFAIGDRRPWTHLRLNIFPDGGVARLRVYGEAAIDWARIAQAGRAIDLASILNGGLVLGASDMHFGAKDNMIMPGRAPNMGDGWETRRRRGPGQSFVGHPPIRLGHRPARRAGHGDEGRDRHQSLQGQLPGERVARGMLRPGQRRWRRWSRSRWVELLPRTKLRAHHRHYFTRELRRIGPISHVRLNIFPDGGISRLRVHGTRGAGLTRRRPRTHGRC